MNLQDGAVAFIDVLGWKGIYSRQTDAISIINKIYNRAKDYGSILMLNPEILPVSEEFKKLKTEIINISDTIVISAFGDCNVSLSYLGMIAKFLIVEALQKEILVRGAISFGRYAMQKSVLVGPAVDEVASWYEVADWIGVFFTPSALYSITEIKSRKIITYNVPTKYGIFETLCVNWGDFWR